MVGHLNGIGSVNTDLKYPEKKYGFITQIMLDSTNCDSDFMNTIIIGDESWVYEYDPETKSFRHFPYNENSTRALNIISLKFCLPSTNAIDKRKKFTDPYEGSRSPHASALH